MSEVCVKDSTHLDVPAIDKASFSETFSTTNDTLNDRILPDHDVLPPRWECCPLDSPVRSQTIAHFLRTTYYDSAEVTETNWLKNRAVMGGREAIRPANIIPNFTREKNGKLTEYVFLFAGADKSNNIVYVFKSKEDSHRSKPTRDDYLVISAYGTEGTVSEPIVADVKEDENGHHRLELHVPKFNPKLDGVPSHPLTANPAAVTEYTQDEELIDRHGKRPIPLPDKFGRMVLEWDQNKDGKITGAISKIYTNNGFTDNRAILSLQSDETIYERDRLHPEERAKFERMVDEILLPEPEAAAVRHELAKFAHDDMGNPVQEIRDREAPPPGKGLDNVVALGVAPQEGLVFSIRTSNHRSDSSEIEHYSIAIVDTNTGRSYKPSIYKAEPVNNRICLTIENFDSQNTEGNPFYFVSWSVSDTGAGYDVTFKRGEQDTGNQLSAIDDLFRMIRRRSGGLELYQIVAFDKMYAQIAHTKEIAKDILNDPTVYKNVDDMLRVYTGSNPGNNSELPEMKRTRRQGNEDVEADFKYMIGTFVLGRGIVTIRSTRDDRRGNPEDYMIIYCDTKKKTIKEFPAIWSSSDGKRYGIAFKEPKEKTKEIKVEKEKVFKLSCDILDGEISSDSWVLEPWGEPLPPLDVLLEAIYEEELTRDDPEDQDGQEAPSPENIVIIRKLLASRLTARADEISLAA